MPEEEDRFLCAKSTCVFMRQMPHSHSYKHKENPAFLVCKVLKHELGQKEQGRSFQLRLQPTSPWQPAECLKSGTADASLQKAHCWCSECQREGTLEKMEFCCLLPWADWATPSRPSLPALTSSHVLGTGPRAQSLLQTAALLTWLPGSPSQSLPVGLTF